MTVSIEGCSHTVIMSVILAKFLLSGDLNCAVGPGCGVDTTPHRNRHRSDCDTTPDHFMNRPMKPPLGPYLCCACMQQLQLLAVRKALTRSIGVACTEGGVLEADCAVADQDEARVVAELRVVH